MSTQVARPVPFPTTFTPITNKPRRSSDPSNLSISPSKLSPEHRYAGGAFEYSPEPESLPLPSFLKRQIPSSPTITSPALSPANVPSSPSSPSHSADFSSSDEEDGELKPQVASKNTKRRYNKRTGNTRRASRNSQQH